jgi:hypothetical protein
LSVTTPEKAFTATRRRGLRGRIGLFRGVVLDSEAEVVLARSPRLAAVIAGLLSGEDFPRVQVEHPSPLQTYSVSRVGLPERYLVVADWSTRSNRSPFGDWMIPGMIAETQDASLAEDVAHQLNTIDPRARPRVMRGMGWW